MDESVYKEIFSCQKGHWFFDAKINFFKVLAAGALKDKKNLTVIDLGCGTGALLEYLSGYGRVIGAELSPVALSYARKVSCGSGVDFLITRADMLAIKKNSVDLICLSDVLSQKDAETDKILPECYRILKKGGIILISDPAFQVLKAGHDSAATVVHRFSIGEMRERLIKNGFSVKRISYVFFLLFPVLFILKVFKRVFHKEKEEPKMNFYKSHEFINSLARNIFYIEGVFLKMFNIPLGISVMSLGVKK